MAIAVASSMVSPFVPTSRLRPRSTTLALATGAAALLAWACLKPTQITLRIDTDVDCAALVKQGGTAIISGPASGDPLTTTTACTGTGATRSIGTLVFTPSNRRDDLVTIAVVAGVTRPLEQCAANAFEGCVVARRRLRFVPHEPLELPVRLSRACVSVVCGDEQTCVEGSCASADVEARCSGPNCGSEPPTPPAGSDAGAEAGPPVVVEAGTDAGVADAEIFEPGSMTTGITANLEALYWTEFAEKPNYRNVRKRLWKEAFGAGTTVLENVEAYGLSATTGTLYLAGRFNGMAVAECALTNGVLGAPTGVAGSAPGWSVDFLYSQGTQQVWTEGPTLMLGAPIVSGLNMNSFIESDHNGVVYAATNDAVLRIQYGANATDAGSLSAAAGGASVVGIAVDVATESTGNTLFVSTQAGDVFKISRDTGSVTRLGYVEGAQDLVVSTALGTRDVFVAGAKGISVFRAVP